MTQQMSFSNTKLNKVMNPDQFNQVVEAILAGKYSWACVLILRFAGYNPLHYIPYRTYNRLLKDNCQFGKPNRQTTEQVKTDRDCSRMSSEGTSNHQVLSKINDLAYLEVVGAAESKVRGGIADWLDVALADKNMTWKN